MKYKFVLFITLLSLFVFSCTKDNLDFKNEDNEELSESRNEFMNKLMLGYELLGGDINTVVGIEASKIGESTRDIRYHQHIHSLNGNTKHRNFWINGVNLEFGEEAIENAIINSDFFGTSVLFETKKANNGSKTLVGTLDCPTEIDIIAPIIKNNNRDKSYFVEWNTDLSNNKGVVIRVSYNADHFFNEAYKTTHPHSCEYAVLTEDDGEKIIDLPNGIPNGSFVYISIIRGDVKIISEYLDNDEINKYGVYCLTKAYKSYRLD